MMSDHERKQLASVAETLWSIVAGGADSGAAMQQQKRDDEVRGGAILGGGIKAVALPEIERELQRLNEANGLMSHAIDDLWKRAAPVIRSIPAEGATATEGPPPCASELGQRIQQEALRLQGRAFYLRELMDLLAV